MENDNTAASVMLILPIPITASSAKVRGVLIFVSLCRYFSVKGDIAGTEYGFKVVGGDAANQSFGSVQRFSPFIDRLDAYNGVGHRFKAG